LLVRAAHDRVVWCESPLRLENSPGEDAEPWIFLVHQLLSTHLTTLATDNQDLKVFSISMESDHLQMARKCLEYLSKNFVGDAWDCRDQSMQVRYPLMCYSTKAWGCHARNSGVAAIQLLDLYKHFFEGTSIQFWWLSCRRQTSFSRGMVQALDALKKKPQPPLHIAAELGIIAFAKARFPSQLSPQQKKVRVAEKDGIGLSATVYASWKGYYDLVQLILELGADVDDLAVFVATVEDHHELLTFQLEHGGNASVKGIGGQTTLYEAAGQGLEHIVELLLKYGADVNALSQDQGLSGTQWTPVIAMAVMMGHESIIRTLLPKTRDVSQYLAEVLVWSPVRGNESLIRLLVGNFPRFAEGTDNKHRFLDKMVSAGAVDILKLVLDRYDIDANTTIAPRTTKEPTTLLGLAMQNSRTDMIHCLFERGAK
jgi:ankyrin repeat protein